MTERYGLTAFTKNKPQPFEVVSLAWDLRKGKYTELILVKWHKHDDAHDCLRIHIKESVIVEIHCDAGVSNARYMTSTDPEKARVDAEVHHWNRRTSSWGLMWAIAYREIRIPYTGDENKDKIGERDRMHEVCDELLQYASLMLSDRYIIKNVSRNYR